VGVSPLANFFLSRSPVLFVSENGTSGKRSVQKFFITPKAVENLLFHQRRMFARVEVSPSEHKNRFLAIAHRRRVGHLVVVTGPTASGKSTLIERLAANAAPELAARLGIGDGRDWRTAGSKELPRIPDAHLPKLLFHYDFLRPYLRSAKVHARDEGLDVLEGAERLSIVTIWTPPDVLRAQLLRGEIEPRTTLGVFWGRKRHRILLEEYADPARVIAHYRTWFAFCRGLPGEHVVLMPGDPPTLSTPEVWEAQVAKPLESGGPASP
jgi:hypothetical protein